MSIPGKAARHNYNRGVMELRNDGRSEKEIRPVKITPGILKYAEGSCLVETGDTKVIVSVSVEDKVPQFLKGTSQGWLTAEYSMLPRATAVRTPREVSKGRPGGRTMEIQRLIGRSLRAAVDLGAIGERTLWVDCDVIQADGGTRTASITGGFVALAYAVNRMRETGLITCFPVVDYVAAISVGVISGEVCLDLCYEEDSRADVDMNVVMTGRGEFIEVQGTAEHSPFDRERLNMLLDTARLGIQQLMEHQREALGRIAEEIGRYVPGTGKTEERFSGDQHVEHS